MTKDPEQAWTQRNLGPALGCFDHALTRAAASYYRDLSYGLSGQARAEKIDGALEDLEKLYRSKQSPDYHNEWVAFFHFLWYQPKQIRIAYRAAKKILNSPRPGQDSIRIFDFGCGSLSMQFGLILVLADKLDRPGTISPVQLYSYDKSVPMTELGQMSWNVLMSDNIPDNDEIRYVSDELLTSRVFSYSDTLIPFDMDYPKASPWYITALHCFYEDENYDYLSDLYRHLDPRLSILTSHQSKVQILHDMGIMCEWSSGTWRLDIREQSWEWEPQKKTLSQMNKLRREIHILNPTLRMSHRLTKPTSWDPRETAMLLIQRMESHTGTHGP